MMTSSSLWVRGSMIRSSPTPFQPHILGGGGSFSWINPIFPSHFLSFPLTDHLPTWVPASDVSTTLPSQPPTPPISPMGRPWLANHSPSLFCCPRSLELTPQLSWPPPSFPCCCLATSLLASSPSLSLYLCLSQCLSPAVPPHSDTPAGKAAKASCCQLGNR